MGERRDDYSGKRWYGRDEKKEGNREKRSFGGKKEYNSSNDHERKEYAKPRGSYHKNGSEGDKQEYSGGYGKKPRQEGYVKKEGSRGSFERKPYQDGYKKERDEAYDRNKPAFRKKYEEEEKVQEQAGGEDTLPFLLIGRNAVREAVKSGRSIDKILVTAEHDGSLGEIVTLAKDAKIIIRETDRKKLDELCMPFGHGGKTANHQGIVAYAAGMEYCTVADILKFAKEKGEDPFVIILDGVEDPHNLGSIIRSAECAGAHGVIIGKRRSASVTAAAVKAAAGATSYMNVARVTNVSGAMEELKRAGLWIAGADMAGKPMHQQGMNGPLAIVIGSEGNGLTKLVKDTCDFLVSIPMFGQINSLNASVAAGILMFEKRRQDAVEEV